VADATTIPAPARQHAPALPLQMEQPRRGSSAGGPRSARPSSRIMAAMQNAHVRRYVLMRHRDLGSPATRWSLARIATTPRDTVGVRPAAAGHRRRDQRG
jgi:hypothetical protein